MHECDTSVSSSSVKAPCLTAGSVHLPYDERTPEKFTTQLRSYMSQQECLLKHCQPVVVVCRKGNDSQQAAKLLKDEHGITATDLEGGLIKLADFDPGFPYL